MNPSRGVGLLDAVLDQLVRQLRWHQVAGVEVALGLQPERRAVADVLAEKVPGGDLRNAELLGQLLGLRALARPGRSEQNDSHFRNPS